MFSKILIANRGEIACRVIRTARALGYGTVAVFSDADAQAPHVSLADEAVRIGPAPATESYLDPARLFEAAKRTGADALHPGYGFLSENAAFAAACREAHLTFIGPPAEAIRAMGDKASAKGRMRAAGVPTVPGYLGDGADGQSDARFLAEGEKLGLPLLVKATAGGGGRGMRLVRALADLPAALVSARREAQSAFGDGRLMLERLIERGRHIEVQVFADAHGNAVYLGERDCTAQRRRQKVIEEAPSPIVSPALREQLGRSAVAAALAVGYRGAGTIEFIVPVEPSKTGELAYFFLEMNTRLQVEHPVTELITGLDLVEWQLRVAAGQPLPRTQADIHLNGHAIEARLYAEDPYTGFAPQTGRIAFWRPERATQQAGVRIDDGVREGDQIGPFYDAMVAKVIAHGRDRDDAIRRLRAALAASPLLGLRNNGRFLRDLLGHDAFRAAKMTTALLDEWIDSGEPLLKAPAIPERAWLAAAVRLTHGEANLGLRADSARSFDLTLQSGETRRTLRVGRGAHQLAVEMNGQTHALEIDSASNDADLRLGESGHWQSVLAFRDGESVHVSTEGATHVFAEVSAVPSGTGADASDPRRLLSPVAGVVAQVLATPGLAVLQGQQLVSVEAMKMEMWLTARAPGKVSAVRAKPGDRVQSGAVLVELEFDDPSTEQKPTKHATENP